MGLYINIRTENSLGSLLSKTFQSFVNGFEIDGESCELNQVSKLLNLDLKPFTIFNYSGLWDESEFPEDRKDELIKKQIENDKIWNDINEFLDLINILIHSINTEEINSKKITHKYDWWNKYFELPNENDNNDNFLTDLKIIKNFLIVEIKNGETKTAFYSE